MNSGKKLELFIWIAALVSLASVNHEAEHFKLCILSLLKLEWCPGCGLGRSVSCILQGKFADSFHYHWLGFPGLLILLNRIFILGKNLIPTHEPR